MAQQISTTIARPVSAQIEVKRSRFLCDLVPVADEAQARAVVDAARRRHWDARHHCSAFVLGPLAQTRRSNDDGEPSGTAGAPMLDALTGAGLSDVVAVVTRWFGGTLLGAGGLVRAYGDAVRAAIADAQLVRLGLCRVVEAEVALADVGRVENAIRAGGYGIEDVDYATAAAKGRAVVRITVEPDRVDGLSGLLAEVLGAPTALVPRGERWLPLN